MVLLYPLCYAIAIGADSPYDIRKTYTFPMAAALA